MVKVAPSLLAADFRVMGVEIERVAAAGADCLHFDVMDGAFVPEISFGSGILKWAAKGPLPVDAHLMIERPEAQVANFAKAGAKIITIHAEAGGHLHRTLALIREHGCLAGLALNPATTPDCLRYLLPSLDLVLVMTVKPGFGGQTLREDCVAKIPKIREMIAETGRDILIEVDGGVKQSNAAQVIEAGADVLVMGTGLFRADDPKAVVKTVLGE